MVMLFSMMLLAVVIDAKQSTLIQANYANCFDYTNTNYLSQISNDFGTTTMMQIKGKSVCQMFIYTGIARVVYPNQVSVNWYKQNSAKQWVPASMMGGNVPSGQAIQWYNVDGSAGVRLFVVTNTNSFPVSFNINVQTYEQLRSNSGTFIASGFIALALSAFLLFFS